MTQDRREALWMADLYGEMQLAEHTQRPSLLGYIPGLALVGVAALASLWLAEQYGAPAVLMGLLIGFALNFTNADRRLAPGLDLSSQTLLRIGIVLIGMRISFAEIAALGIVPFLSLAGIMAAVIAAGVVAAKLLKLDLLFGLLAGGATAICGASAALALWSIIGERRISQERFTIVLLGTTLASAFALTFYPALAGMLSLNDTQAGFLTGASIHDVAQALAGGFAFSEQAGEVATVVKLSRVALLVPILVLVSLALQRFSLEGEDAGGRKFSIRQGLPWFILGFIALVAVNSVMPIPQPVVDFGSRTASTLLLFAVIAAAIKSNLSGMLAHGLRSFGPVIITTLTAFGLSLLAVQFL